ncbi:MAG TPA: YeeE/YedE family protein, partial [Candidatus Methylomirabilis sp.]|nr:YeeE/YedE family protein [Candidatus Methylomirabilis sp.]
LAFAALMARMVPDPSTGEIAPKIHVWPIGINVLVGGLLFGAGMVLAGGCISGTLWRVAEGYVGSLVTLVGILLGLEGATLSWNWWWKHTVSRAPMIWLPHALGHMGAWIAVVTALAGLYLLTYWWEARRAGPEISFPEHPRPPLVTFHDRLRAMWNRLFVDAWPPAAAAVALALLNVTAFSFEHPLGVTGELSAWSSRIFTPLGVSPGHLEGLDQFSGCNLVDAPSGLLTNSFALDMGLVFGAFAASVMASEFKVRVPRQPVRYLQSVVGGVLMGYGAGIALGCTIGAFFSAIPSLGLNGWLFGLGLLGGSFVGSRIIRRLA